MNLQLLTLLRRILLSLCYLSLALGFELRKVIKIPEGDDWTPRIIGSFAIPYKTDKGQETKNSH